MHVLVAGAAARLGVALGSALVHRGHSVTVADRFEDLDARRAAAWFEEEGGGGTCLRLAGTSLERTLRCGLTRAHAVVLVGDPRDAAFDLELTIAAADAAVSLSRAIPLLRLTALEGTAGAASTPIVVHRGRARLRDLPLGIPVERTAAVLPEPDVALRLMAAMRDQRSVVLRAAECLARGRFQFETWDTASLAMLSTLAESGTSEMAAETTVDLLDGRLLSAAVERCVHRADSLDGRILHLTGGPGCRLELRRILAHQSLLVEPSPAVPFEAGAVAPAPPKALLLDDGPSRRELGFSDLTWAPRAIAEFHRFAAQRIRELSFPTPRFA